VSRTGFHNWERRAPSDRALTDAWLIEKIRHIHKQNRGGYGAPRIHAELRLEHGIHVGRKPVARLMKAADIAGVRPRKRWRTTIRIPGITPASDLVARHFRSDRPNVLWVADITYLRTGEGWLYLAAVQDTYSRQVVGWSMATHMRSSLVVDALTMALARRRPDPGLIHHSDQGSQYVSLAFGRAAGEAGIAVSMGSRGDAYDNAVAETFFATLKKELVNRRARRLARLPRGPQVRVAKLILKRIGQITTEERELRAEITALIEAHCPVLLAEHGCGPITAAIIIGHTAGAQRFPTDACFARHTGTARIPASSGNTQRHRLHRGGDRQLNRAIHIIALSRARTDPATRTYLERKHTEGKTKREAIRCLKRHLARRIWRLLYATQSPASPPPALGTITPRPPSRRPISPISGIDPDVMPCAR
jgi:putative transposase